MPKSLKIPMYATAGTAKYLAERGYEVTTLHWPDESDDNVIKAIKEGVVDFVVNLPKNSLKSELTNGTRIRQAAVTFDCPLLTDMEKATAYIRAIANCPDFQKNHKLIPLAPYHNV